MRESSVAQMDVAAVRAPAQVSAYLVLYREDEVLLLLRENTGYCDGLYGLVSGHVETGESAKEGMIREAYEEAGIEIKLSDLTLVHTLHRKTNRSSVDLFFACTRWTNEVVNREPHKCGELKFFPKDQLPAETIEYIKEALHAIERKEAYSEKGWKE